MHRMQVLFDIEIKQNTEKRSIICHNFVLNRIAKTIQKEIQEQIFDYSSIAKKSLLKQQYNKRKIF